MNDESRRSVDVIHNQHGKPHVRQQAVEADAEGVSDESTRYTEPVVELRLVSLTELT